MAKKPTGERRAAKTSKRSKKNAEDRLGKAILEKQITVTVAGRELTLKKWTLRQGIRMTGKIATVIRQAMPTGQPQDLLSADVEGLISDHEESFMEILAVSIMRGNFDSEEEAKKWLDDEVNLEDGLELFTHIGRLNIRPLIQKLASMRSVIKEDALAGGNGAAAQQ